MHAPVQVVGARFDLILSDPAWTFEDKLGKRGAAANYAEQGIEALLRLPVARIASANSVHLMWVVDTHLPEGIALLTGWGYQYVGVPFVWAKKTSRGNRHFGLGRTTRKEVELVLLGRRGKGLPRVSASVRQMIEAPVREHSRKPDEIRDRIVELYGDVRRLEMNARTRALGWHSWGFDVGASDQTLRSVNAPLRVNFT